VQESMDKLAKLLEPMPTGTVKDPISSVEIKVRGLTFGEIGEILDAAKSSRSNLTLGVVTKATVDPQLTWEKAKKLKAPTVNVIVSKVLELSGFTKELLEGLENLPETISAERPSL